MGAVFLIGAGVVGAISAVLPGPPDMNRLGLAALCGGTVALGVIAWVLPWERWPSWSNLVLLPIALTILAFGNIFNGTAPYSYGSYYVVAFVWVGMAHGPGTSLLMSPLLVVSYLLPLMVLPGDFPTKASSLVLVLPTCVIVGELLSLTRRRVQRTEEQLRAYSAELEDANHMMIERDRDLRSVLAELRDVEAERRSLLDRTVSSLEEERKRIAIELHDGPIQHLTALDYGLETARTRLGRGDRDAAMASLARAQQLAREDVVALRHLMKGLRPPVLDEYGLATALGEYLASVAADSRIGCDVNVDLPVRLGSALETVLYRVALEAFTNVVRHSRAEHAKVDLRVDDGSVVLDVRDDGIGFDPASADRDGVMSHYGLMGMRQRIQMVGGSWEILPNPGGGTWVHVLVPLGSHRRPTLEPEPDAERSRAATTGAAPPSA